MITSDRNKLEAVKSEEYLDVDNMYSLIPVEIRLHMQRVSGYAGLIVDILNKSEKYDDISWGIIRQNCGDIFRYHDIGLCFLPVKTMCKSKEYNIFSMKKFYENDFDGSGLLQAHVDMGNEAFNLPIFNKMSKEVFLMATDVAAHHHERWDGKGFPDGLFQGEISLVSRICAVADMYDMLIEFNPYGEDEDNSKIIQGLQQVSGTFLDPGIVDLVADNADLFRKYDNKCGSIMKFNIKQGGI